MYNTQIFFPGPIFHNELIAREMISVVSCLCASLTRVKASLLAQYPPLIIPVRLELVLLLLMADPSNSATAKSSRDAVKLGYSFKISEAKYLVGKSFWVAAALARTLSTADPTAGMIAPVAPRPLLKTGKNPATAPKIVPMPSIAFKSPNCAFGLGKKMSMLKAARLDWTVYP